MDHDLSEVQMADMLLAKAMVFGEEVTLAFGKFDDVTHVGCGANRKAALENLFKNAFAGKQLKYDLPVLMSGILNDD